MHCCPAKLPSAEEDVLLIIVSCCFFPFLLFRCFVFFLCLFSYQCTAAPESCHQQKQTPCRRKTCYGRIRCILPKAIVQLFFLMIQHISHAQRSDPRSEEQKEGTHVFAVFCWKMAVQLVFLRKKGPSGSAFLLKPG